MKPNPKVQLNVDKKELQLIYYSTALALKQCQEAVKPRVQELLDKIYLLQKDSF